MKKTTVVRRSKFHNKQLIHKRIQCPHCGSRIIDADSDIDSEVRVIKESDQWRPEYYTKCWNCKAEIGLKIIK